MCIAGGGSLCSEVLGTAVGVVQALPPLSLAVESKLPRVGLASLAQLTAFLGDTAKPSSPADPIGEFLCVCVCLPSFVYVRRAMLLQYPLCIYIPSTWF